MKPRNPTSGRLVRSGASRSEGASWPLVGAGLRWPARPTRLLGVSERVARTAHPPPPPRACALARPQMAARGMPRASSGADKCAGMTLAGLEPAIFASEDQRLIH